MLDLVAAWAFSLVVVSKGYSVVVVHGLLIVLASLVADHRLLDPQASVDVACGL